MTEERNNQAGKAEGERETPEELLSLLYDDLRRLAAARMAQEPGGQTLQATALVHEAWLALTRSKDQTWKDRAHFFGAAAEAMRRILVDNARRKSRQKRGGGQERLNIEEVEVAGGTQEEKLLLIDEALERFEKEDPEKAQLVLLKFFGGLTNQEAATRLGVTERTVERNWAFARARLFCMIRKDL